MQVTSHAGQGFLNHSFIHLAALRDTPGSQPHPFLQQIVTRAAYHSGWVARVMGTCKTVGYDFNDPSISNVVVAVASIPWFFQFVIDESVSKSAFETFGKCETCLVRL